MQPPCPLNKMRPSAEWRIIHHADYFKTPKIGHTAYFFAIFTTLIQSAMTSPMDTEALQLLKERHDAIPKGDPRIESYLSDSVLTGDPDVVIRPRDWLDVSDLIHFCNGNKLPLTVCGSRTSMTGSSVAMNGVLLTLEGFDKLIDIREEAGHMVAVAETGIVVGDFQRLVKDAGFFYPPAPTSVTEARLGSTIATNATGEDTFKYGPTRKYVRRLKLISADGNEFILERPLADHPLEIKAKGGYYMHGSPIDLFIGSEGTLGIIKEVTVDLLPASPAWFVIVAPFRTNMDALTFIRDTATASINGLRALEFIDHGALKYMSQAEHFPATLKDTEALVIIKQEYNETSHDLFIEQWLSRLAATALADIAIVASEPREQEDVRQWRHHIPEAINEIGRSLHIQGGGKVSGDWWVPIERMPEMMEFFYNLNSKTEVEYIAYGHLGNGHPHTSYIARDHKEMAEAEKLIETASRHAVELGGGVAGEHGIGKIKKFLLPIQYSADVIEKMKAIKTKFDPNWILAQGNIF